MLFKCKQFDIKQSSEVFKITTDATLLGALAWSDTVLTGNKTLEVGSGTGIISLMLAQRFSQVEIEAIDKSIAASNLTKQNFEASKYTDRLFAANKDVLSCEEQYNHIIINPPYFQDDTKSQKSSEHEARHLENMNYRVLIKKLLDLLEPGGSIEMIHPVRYMSEIEKAVIACGGGIERIINIRHNDKSVVRNSVTRILNSSCVTRSQFFNIRQADNQFSKEYVELLREFINV